MEIKNCISRFIIYKLVVFILLPVSSIFATIDNIQEILALTEQAKDSLSGDIIDVYYEYSFTGNTNGSAEEIVQVITLINGKQGLEKSDLKIPYNSTNESVELIRGRVIRHDGKIIKIGKESTRTEGYLETLDLKIYSDQMLYIITLPGLAVGAIADITYRIRKKSFPIKGEFWGKEYMHRGYAAWRWKFNLKLPANKMVKIKNYHCENPILVKKEKNIQEYFCEGGPYPEIKYEILMPHPADMTPVICFSTVRSNEEIRKWYHSMVEQKMKQSKEIIIKAVALTYMYEDKLQQAINIAKFVRDNIRYVALEFGSTSIIPTDASEVLECRYGDCKDKSILLKALLNVIGIKTFLILLSSIEQGKVSIDIPTLSQFSHVIVYIPEFDLFIDPTFNYGAIGTIPFNYQGTKGLIIGDTVVDWIDIPVDTPEKNKSSAYLKIQIEKSGNAFIQSIETHYGLMASFYRNLYGLIPNKMRDQMVKATIASLFHNIQDISYKFVNLDSVDQALICSTSVYCKSFAEKTGNLMIFNLPTINIGFDIKPTLSDRIYDLHLPFKSSSSLTVEIEFPPEYVLVEQISPFDIKNSFAEFNLNFTQKKNIVLININTKLTDNVIPREKFDELKNVMNAKEKLNKKIILRKK